MSARTELPSPAERDRVDPVRLALVALLCATLLVGWWSKARCLTDGQWDGGEEWLGWCYTDVYPLWFAERLHEGATPYFDHPVEYPVLIGLQMGLTAAFTRLNGWGPIAFFHLTALTGFLMLIGAFLLLERQRLGPWRLAWFAGAPTLAVYAFLNWDPLPVLLLVAAIAAHRADRDGWSGVLAGLGVAAKLFPGILVPLVVLARWQQGRVRTAALHVGAAAGVWVAVNLPIALAAPEGWARFFVLSRERNANFDSLWYLAEQIRGAAFPVPALNRGTALLLLAGAAGILAVGLRRYASAELWRLALPLLAWFILTNKVYSPQYSLWLLPLLALALPRVAPFAAFAVSDLLVFAVEFPFLGHVIGLSPAPGYPVLAFALLVRAAVLVWIILDALTPAANAEMTPGPTPAAADPAAPGSPAQAVPRSALDLG